MACTLVVVTVCVLAVNTATGNHCQFSRNMEDRNVIGSNKSVLRFVVVICRIDSRRNEVLFFGGIKGVFILPL